MAIMRSRYRLRKKAVDRSNALLQLNQKDGMKTGKHKKWNYKQMKVIL